MQAGEGGEGGKEKRKGIVQKSAPTVGSVCERGKKRKRKEKKKKIVPQCRTL